MFNPESPISQFVSLSTHITPHIIKTTGGDYLTTWYLSGLPFVGREEWELEHKHNTFNRLLQSLRAPDYVNVAFWIHDIRRHQRLNLNSKFEEQFNQDMSDSYFNRLSQEKLMNNELYLTMIYRPNVENKKFAAKSTTLSQIESEQKQAISVLDELATNLEAVLKDYIPHRLGLYENGQGVSFSETLELFGYVINRVTEPVPVLEAPIYNYLPISRHLFSTKTGDFVVRTPSGENHYGAMLNLKEYPDGTYPGILNGLKYLDMEYVVTHSFSPKSRYDAMKTLERTRGMMISSGDKSFTQIAELDHAMDQLASGNFVLGEYHFNLAIYAPDQVTLSQNVAAARAELSNAGFVTTREDLAICSAFYAQLPANWKYRTRIANLSSLNFLGLSPLHNFAIGKRDNNPWGQCVTVLQTTNGQPYFFNFHATLETEKSEGEKAIANTMVIGKSGTGKTALINFLLSQVQKFDPKPTIFFFDKDRGAEIFVRACGGAYIALENGQPTGFNPFQCDNTESNVQFLSSLIKELVGKTRYTASEEEDILRAIRAMLDTPMHLRSMTNFQKSLPNHGDGSLYAEVKKWTKGNSLGWVFDNPKDEIDFSHANIIGFDYTEIIDNTQVRSPVISYLIHRMEALIDGRRFIYVMDEFWKILDGGSGLKDFAKNKQKTIRKQNGLGVFATQSPEDALRSDISVALIEQTATMVLLPNPTADREDYMEGLKLTESEFQVVKNLDERSRCFLVKQGHASAVCQLNLRGMDNELAVISASTDNIEIMDRIVHEEAEAHEMPLNQVTPEMWLERFYSERKGSGKRMNK